MTTQREFFVHTIIWAGLMVASATGLFASFIFLWMDNPQEETRSLAIAALLVCALSFFGALHKVIQGERLWKQRNIRRILSNPARVFAKWEYPKQQWQRYKSLDLKERNKQPLIATAVVVGFAALGFCIAFFGSEEANSDWLGVAFLALLLLGHVVWKFTHHNLARLKAAYERHKEGRIVLSPEGAVINGEYLIPFDYQGGTLMQVQKVDYHEIPSLQFTVRIRAGSSNAFHQYHIPVPEGHDFEGSWVRQQYEKHLKRQRG